MDRLMSSMNIELINAYLECTKHFSDFRNSMLRFKSLSHGFGLHVPGEWMKNSTVEACEAMVAQSLLHGLSHPEATSPLDAVME